MNEDLTDESRFEEFASSPFTGTIEKPPLFNEVEIIDYKNKMIEYVFFSKKTQEEVRRPVSIANLSSDDLIAILRSRKGGNKIYFTWEDEEGNRELTEKQVCKILGVKP